MMTPEHLAEIRNDINIVPETAPEALVIKVANELLAEVKRLYSLFEGKTQFCAECERLGKEVETLRTELSVAREELEGVG